MRRVGGGGLFVDQAEFNVTLAIAFLNCRPIVRGRLWFHIGRDEFLNDATQSDLAAIDLKDYRVVFGFFVVRIFAFRVAASSSVHISASSSNTFLPSILTYFASVIYSPVLRGKSTSPS